MSALRVSRSAAEENALIAASQFFASMAVFPAAYSGSSCSAAGVSSFGSPTAVAGKSAKPRPTSATETLTPITQLFARQPLLHLAQLGAVTVRVARETCQLVEVVTRLFRVARRLRGLGHAVEAAQPHRRVLERGLVFLQRRFRLALRYQHVAEQLTHRIETILHRDMLLASVLEIGGGAHELQRVLLVALGLGDPGLGREDLDLDLTRPVRLTRLFKRRAQLLQLVDVGRRCGEIIAAGSAQRACEVRDGLRLRRIDDVQHRKGRRSFPVLALQHVARRYGCRAALSDVARPGDLP